MPAAPTVRPPRKGPIIRHASPAYNSGSKLWAESIGRAHTRAKRIRRIVSKLSPALRACPLPPIVARALVPVSMGPGGGPTKMYENPRVSRPLPLIWGWVFDAAAPALVPAHGALPPPSTRRAFFGPVTRLWPAKSSDTNDP